MGKLPEVLTIPAGVDIHVHFREPSTNGSETIASGSLAALIGGFVLVADMTNNPGFPTWTTERILDKHDRAQRTSRILMGFYIGSQPDHDNVAELPRMIEYGIGTKFYSTGTTGNDVEFGSKDFKDNTKVLNYLDPTKPIMLHASKENLEDMIGMIAGDFDHPLHICHVNDPEEVKLINAYKRKGLKLTSGVTMHHLVKNSQDVDTEGSFAQMQPPLVPQHDSEQLLHQLVNNEIDIVESDHAPHKYDSKVKAEEEHSNCYGVPGIEFSIPLLLRLASIGKISVERIVEATSTKPAQILGVKVGRTTTATWHTKQYRIEDEKTQIVSGAGWTPYLGMLAGGSIKNVLINGKYILFNGNVIGRDSRVITSRGQTI